MYTQFMFLVELHVFYMQNILFLLCVVNFLE